MNLEYLNGSLFFHMFVYSYANSAEVAHDGIILYLCYVSIGMVLDIFGIIASILGERFRIVKNNGLMCLDELLKNNGFIVHVFFSGKCICMKQKFFPLLFY